MNKYEEISAARKILGLPETANMASIKRNYRRLLAKWHPDKCDENREACAEMKVLFIITTNDGETIFNAMRLANVGVKNGDEVSVFMLGKGVCFEQAGSEQFDVMGQINQFDGDFYV